MITLPFKQNTLNYTMSQLERVKSSSGITHLHTIHGNYKGEYGKCQYCQLGLSLAHLEVWRTMIAKNIPRAWVLEDDVIFHDDFNNLFPKYWQQVPHDALMVWVGHSRTDVDFRCRMPGAPDRPEESEVQAGAGAPWMTHAVIITLEAALLLERSMSQVLAGNETEPNNPSQLRPEDIKIDYFIINVYEAHKQKRRWVKFSSTSAVPAKFGVHTWVARPECAMFATKESQQTPKLQCERDAPGSKSSSSSSWLSWQGRRMRKLQADSGKGGANMGLPVSGVGLAFQNLCKKSPEMLELWKNVEPGGAGSRAGVAAAVADALPATAS